MGLNMEIRWLSVEHGKPLAESIVSYMKKCWYLKLCEEPDPDKIMCLPYANRERLLMLGSYMYDQEVDRLRITR